MTTTHPLRRASTGPRLLVALPLALILVLHWIPHSVGTAASIREANEVGSVNLFLRALVWWVPNFLLGRQRTGRRP